MSALLNETPQAEEEEKEGLRLTRCWASWEGDWTREKEEGGLRARPVLARSFRAGYHHSLALSVATQLARISAGGRDRRRSLATRWGSTSSWKDNSSRPDISLDL